VGVTVGIMKVGVITVGVIVGVVGVAVPTNKVSGALVNPDIAAMILVIPFAMPVANPTEEIVAAATFELVHVTSAVISAVEPSA